MLVSICRSLSTHEYVTQHLSFHVYGYFKVFLRIIRGVTKWEAILCYYTESSNVGRFLIRVENHFLKVPTIKAAKPIQYWFI